MAKSKTGVTKAPKMRIEFQLWGQLREAVEAPSATLTLPTPRTLNDAIVSLAGQYPGLAPRILNEDKSIRASILIFQDGQQLGPDALGRLLENDTSFTLMSPIAGG
jgi:hypothetical protein